MLLEQAKQGHPAANYGDWRDFFDSVQVLRVARITGVHDRLETAEALLEQFINPSFRR